MGAMGRVHGSVTLPPPFRRRLHLQAVNVLYCMALCLMPGSYVASYPSGPCFCLETDVLSCATFPGPSCAIGECESDGASLYHFL
jgi:hypothetical protein